MKTLLFLAVLAISWPAVRLSAEPANPPSPLVTDVIKMARAKVGEDVILAFVESSKEKTPVSAAEILELHSLGVSSRVQIALLNHGQPGAEQVPVAAPAEGVGQLGPVPNPPEPVAVPPTTEYEAAVASPVYVGVGSAYYPAYYPCYDGWYGFGWGFGVGLGWWGWSSCFYGGYPYCGYGYGYGYHCGYNYPACGDGHGSGYYVNNSSSGKVGAAAIGGTGQSAESAGGIIRPGPMTGVAGNTKGVQAGGKPGIAPGSSVLGGNATSQATGPTKPGGSQLASSPGTKPGVGAQSIKPTSPSIGGQSVKPSAPGVGGQSVKPAGQAVQNSSKPTLGSPVGNWPGSGSQNVKPAATSLGTPRAGQASASPGKPVAPGMGTRGAQPGKPALGSGMTSAPRTSAVPGRNPAVYAGSGAKGYSGSGNYGSRPSAGYSGMSGAPRGGYSGGSVASLGYSGGGSKGGYSGFSGSRGGYSGFSGSRGGYSGFSGGRGGGGGGGFSGGRGGR